MSDAPDGDAVEAIRLLERSGEHKLAGEAWERLGRSLEAGRAYEMHLRFEPEDAEVRKRLARALVRHRRIDAAIGVLQAGLDDTATPGDAGLLAWLVAALAARGWLDAALDRLAALRRIDASVPATLDAFLTERFGGPRGLLEDVDEGSGCLFSGRYRVIRELGRGATGRVLLVHDVISNADVALKILAIDGPSGRDALARFVREANAAKALDHPNLVRVFDIDITVPFFAMEWMRGGTLGERVAREGPLSVAQAKRLVESLLEALSALHRRGIVHRDIKPANVFFDEAGNTKLGDLGAAHFVDLGVTMTGAMIGTLATMAPEQLTGSVRPSAATDFYALGAVLVFALTGEYPHPGPDFVEQHLHATPRLPSELRPMLGARFDALVLRLLEKDANTRLASVREVRAALRAIDDGDDDVRASGNAELHVDARFRDEPTAQAPTALPAVRFRFDGASENGIEFAHDLWLERRVELRRIVSDTGLAHYRDLAQRPDPHVQCVYDIDEDKRLVLLEWIDASSARARLPNG